MSLARRTDIARSRFWCWLRSDWTATTMPVGRWVSRTAESVLLTCWPPAPEARYVSTRRSFSSISTLASSGTCGMTSTRAKLVCRRFCESYGLIRTSRCTPRSLRSFPYAQRPSMLKLTLLRPASSPSVASRISVLKRLRSAQRRYMRSSISAQSWLSVPPAPAWTDTIAPRSSYGSRQQQLLLHARPVGLEGGEVALEVGSQGWPRRPGRRRPSRPSRPGRRRAARARATRRCRSAAPRRGA